MATTKQLEKQLRELDKQQKEILQQIEENKKRHTVQCKHCYKGTQVQKLTLISVYQQVTDYDEPLAQKWAHHSYAVPCPTCNLITKFISSIRAGKQNENDSFFSTHKHLFKEHLEYRIVESGISNIGGPPIFRDSQKWQEDLTAFIQQNSSPNTKRIRR